LSDQGFYQDLNQDPDQDFFFDDDEVSEEQSSAASKKRRASHVAENPSHAGETTASRMVAASTAVAIGVAGLALGFAIGVIVPFGTSASAPPPAATGQPASAGTGEAPQAPMGGQMAPELTDEQLESGRMPEGHPDISEMEDLETSP